MRDGGRLRGRGSGSAKGGRSVLDGIPPGTVETRVNIQKTHSGGGSPTVARTAIRPRRMRRTMNKGGKYVGEFVPELVDRYAHFRGFFPVITGFLKPRLTCNRFYFVNPADHCDRPPILPVEPGHFTRRAYIVCVAQMRSRAVAARA
jgi:hypothetical protein